MIVLHSELSELHSEGVMSMAFRMVVDWGSRIGFLVLGFADTFTWASRGLCDPRIDLLVANDGYYLMT